MEKESFSKLESLNCEMEDLKDMVALMLEDCFVFREDSLKDYEVREKYRTAPDMLKAATLQAKEAIYKLQPISSDSTDSRTFCHT